MSNLDEMYDIDHRVDAIANYQDGILVCLAGPGTGKTYSFLRRIEKLTNERHVNVDKICYFTFIREIIKAFAADYREDQESEADETPSPRISTLHSFACRVIRNQGSRLGFDGSLYFTNVAERKDPRSKVFLEDLLPLVRNESVRTVPQLRNVLKKVKKAWRDNTDPESCEGSVPTVLPKCLALSQAYRLIDWDLAVPLAHTLFQNLEELPRWIANIEHFLVDEYQDFNRAEQAFIASLATTVNSMVIVGDGDQSLYSGRGGSPDGLRELYHSVDADQITLVRCHRCKSSILDVANTFLTVMHPDPRLMCSRYDGGKIVCYCFTSRQAEIAYLAEFLNGCISTLPEEPKPKDGIVCLFPNWRSLKSYMALLESEVPCISRKTQYPPKRAWLERALELASNHGQRFVERLFLEDFSDIKPRHKQAMVKLVLEKDLSPVEALDELVSSGVFPGTVASAARGFCDLCRTFSSQDASLIADKLAEYMGIETPELREQIDTFIQQLDEPNQEDRINTLCETIIPESALTPEDPRAVLFLTMHGSKGLTKKTVVMPGLEDAWLPGNVPESDLDEKKRLFYVALTRATDQVLITYPQTRSRGDPLNYETLGRGEVSRFVVQSDIHCVFHT